MTLTALTLLLAAPVSSEAGVSDTKQEICKAFGPRCAEAIRVAGCETGHTYDVRARNGAYWGLFQVSEHWRRTIPGFAWNARAQARHAYRVFKATGYTWRRWSCQP